MEVRRRSYPVDLYTATHHVAGVYDPIGSFAIAINAPDTICFSLADATFAPLLRGAPLRAISVPRLTVNKAQILFITFQDDTVQQESAILRRVERTIVYMPGFVLRGGLHLGAEDQINDVFDTLHGDFQPLTEATIYPLREIQADLRREHDLVMINTRAIQHYHPEATT
ncbi:MAG: hypothetical protein JXA09_12690 [Anaerolineae bacterium]|nr:hypothetical protein [Anaerolineae bacterium]